MPLCPTSAQLIGKDTKVVVIVKPVQVLLVALALAGVLALTLVVSAGAGTDPVVTNHDTTFDNSAPRRVLGVPPLPQYGGKYVDGTQSKICYASFIPAITGPFSRPPRTC